MYLDPSAWDVVQALGDPNRMNFSAITANTFVGHSVQVDINDSTRLLVAPLTGLTHRGLMAGEGQLHEIGGASGEGVWITREQWQKVRAGPLRVDVRNVSDVLLPVVDLAIQLTLAKTRQCH